MKLGCSLLHRAMTVEQVVLLGPEMFVRIEIAPLVAEDQVQNCSSATASHRLGECILVQDKPTVNRFAIRTCWVQSKKGDVVVVAWGGNRGERHLVLDIHP